jgi:hypothetical protein
MAALSCPSCGARSGVGPDEDGHLSCLQCGGPTYCPGCGKPVVTSWNDDDGFACMVCGDVYHAACFPTTTGGSDIVCRDCLNKEPK